MPINFNTKMPVYDELNIIDVYWGNIYDGEPEDHPHSCPPPMGKPILISIFVNDNLMADITTARSQTGIINLISKTSIKWYSNLNITSKLLPMAVNTLPLIFVLTRSLTFVILYPI